MSATRYRIFAGVTPGLEDLLIKELDQLGLAGVEPRAGGVELSGEARDLWSVALGSRLAESLRVRLGRVFEATTFEQLQAKVARLPWAAFLGRDGAPPRVQVTCHKSRLHHSGAVAQRVAGSIRDRLGLAEETGEPATVFVRIVHDQVQLSVDAAGERMHRRGYRVNIGLAPLRETLAAACLMAAGYDGQRPLWDPFCGAGTLIIEAMGMAAGQAPGARRSFAFQGWPTHDAGAFAAQLAGLPALNDACPAALGSDLEKKAVAAARTNARAAGLGQRVSFRPGDFEAVARSAPPGAMIVSNPPYGRRLEGGKLADTFRRLGALLRRRTDLGPVVLLSGHRDLPRHTGLRWETLRSFDNRGLPVNLLQLQR